jgi:hypothetical protein
MKTKLKEPAELSSMANSAYMMKLKSDLSALKASPKEEGPNSFILRAEFQFSDEENTLFVAGINSAWKKHVKEEKWLKTPESKKTLVGTCQFNGDKIELTIIKGKLPKNLFTKAVKANRVLKQYEWVIVKDAPETETEDDDDDDGLAVNGNEVAEQVNEQDKQKAENISKKLIVMLRSLSQLSDKKAKKELVLQIAKEAENLYAINNWEAYTPDKLETALAEIEQALNGYEAENASPDDEDAEKAENICKEMIGLIQQIKGLEDKTKKAQLLDQLSQLKTELEEIPNWKDYTPDNLEKVLGQLDEQEDKEEEKEEAIKAKEKIYFDTTNLKIETLYGTIAKEDFSNLSGLVGEIKSALDTWKTFEDKVKGHPTLADALEKQSELEQQLTEIESIAKAAATIEANLLAFQKAIASKDKAGAAELQRQILAQLP